MALKVSRVRGSLTICHTSTPPTTPTMKCCWLLILMLDIHSSLSAIESGTTRIAPEFAEPVQNMSVPIGRNAQLTCVVNNLGNYKIAWIRADSQTILTVHHNVITRNYRIDLSYADHRYWHLHIKNAVESDRGRYMCQINTSPMKSQLGYLDVVVPPNIIDAETSTDVAVREDANVNITCKATGHPKPTISWRREDGKKIILGNEELDTIEGENLHIFRVSRLHMAAYLCIASNTVPPSVSKRIVLQVHFPPQTWIPNQLVGGYDGSDVDLECHTEAYPRSINYWITGRGDMITSGDKYETIVHDEVYKVSMMLKIRQLEKKDFGKYRCIARNFLGETDGSVSLYEIPATTMSTTVTTEKFNFETKDHLGEEERPSEINGGRGLSTKQSNREQGSRSQPIDEYDKPEIAAPLPSTDRNLKGLENSVAKLVTIWLLHFMLALTSVLVNMCSV